MMTQRQIARTTGWALILMTIAGGFSLGYVLSAFTQPDQTDTLKTIISANLVFYKLMLVGILLVLLLDLLVSYTLYKYFKQDNRILSAIAGTLRLTYSLIFATATYYLVNNLCLDEVASQTLHSNIQSFQFIWSAGLVIFGFHLILIGLLMNLHRRIPKILWYFTLFAGLSYILIHVLKLSNTNIAMANTLEQLLSLPMVVGELGLAIWLLTKGGRHLDQI